MLKLLLGAPPRLLMISDKKFGMARRSNSWSSWQLGDLGTPEFSKDELKFLNKVPDEVQIECPICLQVMLKDPHLVTCCGHHFCGRCIRRAFSQPCPLCKCPSYQAVVNKGLLRTINGLRVYCLNQAEGCEWEGDLIDLNGHLNKGNRVDGCLYVEVDCYYKCSVKMKRHLLENHEKKACPRRPYSCKYCMAKGTYSEITNVHYKKCRNYPIPCPNKCGQKITRPQLDHHIQAICPKQLVVCEYHWIGCNVQPKREDVAKHYSTYVAEHNALIANKCRRLQKENEDLKDRINVINREMKRESTQFDEEIQILNQEMEDFKDYQLKESENYKKMMKEMKREMRNESTRFDWEIQRLNQEKEGQLKENEGFKKRINEMNREMRNESTRFDWEIQRLNQEKEGQLKENEGFKKRINEMNREMRNESTRFDWEIQRLNQEKEGQLKENEDLKERINEMNREMRRESTQFYREIQHLNQQMKDFKNNQLHKKIKDWANQVWEKIKILFLVLYICTFICCIIVELFQGRIRKKFFHF